MESQGSPAPPAAGTSAAAAPALPVATLPAGAAACPAAGPAASPAAGPGSAHPTPSGYLLPSEACAVLGEYLSVAAAVLGKGRAAGAGLRLSTAQLSLRCLEVTVLQLN